ncbi:hypothetical protein E0H26_11835 [Micromonospora zingiberis]|uniref:Uncharacterized protein n=1 Tax=Micromonospora zingiberis TaxID=2053011 RepID=A0A4R0GPS7_9ACTN|nr:hypothetical protein [Micromonospora zingiberis]TCB97601.1 hypothetical protein E0H26_11835 [Micromonospora zingiberis]
MDERPHPGPCPLARPVAHGRPPTPDGTARYPVTPPLPRRQLLPGLIVAGLVLVVMVAGIAGAFG